MLKEHTGISMRQAALIAGFPLMFFTAPYGEFYVFGNLINYHDGAKTTQNLVEHPQLFLSGVFAMMVTFIMDIVLAWALYIFIRPVNESLALLGAWMRIVYAALAIAALYSFLQAYQVANLSGLDESLKHQQVLQLVNARRIGMHLAFFLFGTYLLYGGCLMLKATYIPKFISIWVVLAGVATLMNFSLQPYFFKGYNFSWMVIFSLGELVFAIWLLIKGGRNSVT